MIIEILVGLCIGLALLITGSAWVFCNLLLLRTRRVHIDEYGKPHCMQCTHPMRLEQVNKGVQLPGYKRAGYEVWRCPKCKLRFMKPLEDKNV